MKSCQLYLSQYIQLLHYRAFDGNIKHQLDIFMILKEWYVVFIKLNITAWTSVVFDTLLSQIGQSSQSFLK